MGIQYRLATRGRCVTCTSAPTCSGTPAYTQTVTVNGNGTYNTTNN